MAAMLMGSAVFGAEAPKKYLLNLLLPPKIYAVPGIESNVYFENIVLTINSKNYVFDVDCSKGRNDDSRWRYVPKEKDVGEYPWSVKVLDSENKIVAKGSTKLLVSPKNAGENEKKSILIIGDSLTNATVYARRINSICKLPGNPVLKFIGSHAGGGRPVGPDGVCHEGYGGWAWLTFCGMWTDRDDYRARSKFLVKKNVKVKLDVKAYLAKYNKGVPPDFITIMLGTNDVFAQTDSNIEAQIQTIFKYMDKFVGELAKSAPKARIGIALTPPPAHSQDAFGTNYKCNQTRWQFKRNQHHLVQAMIKKFKSNKYKNISLVPIYLNLDTEHSFPLGNESVVFRSKTKVKRQRNGVHPATPGYNQIGDVFYCWMKYQLSCKEK